MKRLLLVRHGQGQHQISDLTGGWSQVPLTELGYQQASLTGQRLAGLLRAWGVAPVSQAEGEAPRPPALLSSDLTRAAQTAQIISEELARVGIGLEPVLRPGLREFNNGQAANVTEKEAEAIMSPVTEPLWGWRPYPGSETWREMVARLSAEMDALEQRVGETAIVVNHGGSGQAIILWWLRLHKGIETIGFQLDTCSITHLGLNQWGERTLIKLNDTCHLEMAERDGCYRRGS